ncbi:MAG: PIN domain-containing protein [Verrucomicrobia bacterium]|nr:PIN domain-containing protein [Verrucomicrobiota bacterium]
MILVDTSVWVNYLHSGSSRLEELLLEVEVVSHPFIIGELASGGIKNRKEFISLIQALPVTPVITDEEFMHFLESNKLFGIGVGFVDIHLLGSARMAQVLLWTEDKNLLKIAKDMRVSYV